MTGPQLEQLARNPHYTLNAQQLKELEDYRNSLYTASIKVKKTSKKRGRPKKHSTTFQKHDYQLEKEEVTDDTNTNRS